MVLNPIYDGDGDGGPVYNSIKPQYETLPAVAPPRFTEIHQGSSNCSVMKPVHSDNIDVIRYLVIVTRPNMGIRLLVSCRYIATNCTIMIVYFLSQDDGVQEEWPGMQQAPPNSTFKLVKVTLAVAVII